MSESDEKLDQVLHELHELRVLMLGIAATTGFYWTDDAKRDELRKEIGLFPLLNDGERE